MLFTTVISSCRYSLSKKTVDEISEKIMQFGTEMKQDRRSVVGYRLSAEECLLMWLDKFGENAEVELEFCKNLFKYYFRLKVKGENFNPYNNRDKIESYGVAANDILVRVGLIPEFEYHGNTNILTFELKRKQHNQIAVLLAIILLSVFVGLVGKLIVPQSIITLMSEDIVTPIEDTFFDILSAIAGPMIFLSVAWGVYGIGDVYTLGKIGKKMMLEYLKTIFIFVLIGACFYPFLGPALSAASTGTNQFSGIFRMFLSIFPSNIFSPFVEGNTLQIIFLAFIIGLSMIFLGQRTSSVARAIEQINHIINFLMEFVSRLVPFFVFIVLVNLIWTDALDTFKEVWKFTVIFCAAALFCHIAFLLYVSVRNKQNPIAMLKAVLPSYLIAVSTASSSATFESNMKICNQKFGIHKELSSFGVPFGMVTFKPTTALYYLLICFYFASTNDVSVSLSWIVTAVVIAAVSAVATPPIPGGSAATYTILFIQLGIDPAMLTIVLAIDMIFDFIMTSGDMTMLLVQMFHLSGKMGMRDTSVKLK